MKKLDFDEMEEVEGGIECSAVQGVLDYLYNTNPAQLVYVLNNSSLMCYNNGIYMSWWNY
jgi:hypothetical protein